MLWVYAASVRYSPEVCEKINTTLLTNVKSN